MSHMNPIKIAQAQNGGSRGRTQGADPIASEIQTNRPWYHRSEEAAGEEW